MAEIVGKVQEVNGTFEIVNENGEVITLQEGQTLELGNQGQGTVQEIDGILQILDAEGNPLALIDGQELQLNDNIVNPQANNIQVNLNNGQEVIVNNQNPLALDQAVTNNTPFTPDENVVDLNTLDALEEDLGDETNLVVENANDDNEENAEDEVQSDDSKARELDRNGDIANVLADLREPIIDVREPEENIFGDDIRFIEAKISIDGGVLVYEGNETQYTLSLTVVPGTDVIVTLSYSGVAIDGSDYTAIKEVTIPAGSKTTTFTIPTIDDNFSDNNEPYTVVIEDAKGGAYDSLVIDPNKDRVTTVIIDDSEPNTPNDPTDPKEPELDSVTVKLVSTDINGNEIPAVTIPEGETAYYKAILVDENGDEIVGATGDVDITFTDGTAIRTGTSSDGELDFEATDATVTLGNVFSAEALDDYISDSGETFNVQITDDTYTEASKYEDVIHDETPIVTTIIDDSEPNTPNDPTDPKEPELDSVTVKLVSTDINGNEIPAVTIPEGETAYYKAILVDENGDEIVGATGDVDITFTDGTAIRTGTSSDGELDFEATDATVTLGNVFSAQALDDYISDSGETFNVQITDDTYTEASKYEDVIHDETPIVTTIIDDSEPNTPNDPTDPKEPELDSVTVKLVSTDINGNEIPAVTIPEGETAYYKAILVDENGDEIVGATGDVDITFTDGTAIRTGTSSDGELDFEATDATVTLGNVFSAEALDDYISDSGETFNVQITDDTYTEASKYEDVIHDETPIVTTIIDDSEPNTPNDPTDPKEPELDSVTVKLVSTDINGNEIPAVTIPEGETAYYKAILVDENGDEIVGATGDVDITFTDGTAIRTGTSSDGELDFEATDATVTLGNVFSAQALDDYISDSGETFNVQITDDTYTEASKYEDVIHDETPIVTTIIDDSEPNTPNDPTDPKEPELDSVTVKLVSTDINGNEIPAVTIPEGETAYYKAILVDENGDEIVGATGDVDITFTDGTAIRTGTSSDGELDFEATDATVTLGNVFSAQALDDYISDSGETFNVQITDDTYTEASKYEDVIHDETPVVTTITDNSKNTPDIPYDEDNPENPPV